MAKASGVPDEELAGSWLARALICFFLQRLRLKRAIHNEAKVVKGRL
jgi:hypothetical protein